MQDQADALQGVPAWVQLLVASVILIVGSSATTALIVGSREKRAARRERRFSDTAVAAQALLEYRADVLAYALGTSRHSEDKRDKRLAVGGSNVLIACTMVKGGAFVNETTAYIKVAEKFAAEDPATSAEAEATAFKTLIEGIASSRKSAS